MKHLVGKPVTLSIVPEGLLYTVVADQYTIEILNVVTDNNYEMCIVPTDMPDVLEIEPIGYDSLIEALNDADEIIGEMLVEDES